MSFLKLKNYTGKISIGLLFSKLFREEFSFGKEHLIPLTSVRLKIFLYAFIKLLKIYKLKNVFYSLICFKTYGLKLQTNGFYESFVEAKKKDRLKILNKKLFRKETCLFVKKSFQRFFFSDSLVNNKKTVKNLSKGLERFERYFMASSRTVVDRRFIFTLLKAKTFINRIFISRIFLSVAKGRKKYRSSFSYLVRRKRKIESLFNVFTSTSLKFQDIKFQKRKNIKKLAWKRKKQKKWARVGSWNLFRLRQRLSQIFYVPKHFEINYKTLGASYLGFTDFRTTDARIPFWLNLRRLLTFLS